MAMEFCVDEMNILFNRPFSFYVYHHLNEYESLRKIHYEVGIGMEIKDKTFRETKTISIR